MRSASPRPERLSHQQNQVYQSNPPLQPSLHPPFTRYHQEYNLSIQISTTYDSMRSKENAQEQERSRDSKRSREIFSMAARARTTTRDWFTAIDSFHSFRHEIKSESWIGSSILASRNSEQRFILESSHGSSVMFSNAWQFFLPFPTILFSFLIPCLDPSSLFNYIRKFYDPISSFFGPEKEE